MGDAKAESKKQNGNLKKYTLSFEPTEIADMQQHFSENTVSGEN